MNLPSETFPHLQKDLARIGMLPGVTAWDYLKMCSLRHPQLYQRLNPARVPIKYAADLFAGIGELSTHFESKLEKGRGDSYRQAQNTNYLIRSVGFLRIFDLAISQLEGNPADLAILDALGGNGTLTRIIRASRPANTIPYIVTSDVSARMIESALTQDLPAIRLPLQDLMWFEDQVFDAVIVAYGTHHIPPDELPNALAEAYRVLKPGGRIVLQDFEIGCPTTLWYEDVLDRYTLTGHKFHYFSRQQFDDLLVGASFTDIEVVDVYDPLIFLADDPREARVGLLDYVFTLFALEKLSTGTNPPDDRFWNELEAIVRSTSTFDPEQLPAGADSVSEFTVSRAGDRYRAEIPRVCLVATGRRPSAG